MSEYKFSLPGYFSRTVEATNEDEAWYVLARNLSQSLLVSLLRRVGVKIEIEAPREVPVADKDLEKLCDWLAYYSAIDGSMSEHFMDTVDKVRKENSLKVRIMEVR